MSYQSENRITGNTSLHLLLSDDDMDILRVYKDKKHGQKAMKKKKEDILHLKN